MDLGIILQLAESDACIAMRYQAFSVIRMACYQVSSPC